MSGYEQTTIDALNTTLASKLERGYTCAMRLPCAGEPVLFERRLEAPFTSWECGVMSCAEIGLISPVAVLLCLGANCVSIPDRDVLYLGDRTGERDPLLLCSDLSG